MTLPVGNEFSFLAPVSVSHAWKLHIATPSLPNHKFGPLDTKKLLSPFFHHRTPLVAQGLIMAGRQFSARINCP